MDLTIEFEGASCKHACRQGPGVKLEQVPHGGPER